MALLFFMIDTGILLIRDNYAIQRNNMLLLVVTAQQCYNGRTYANNSMIIFNDVIHH